MSVKIMAGVWELELPQGEALVLLALADHADHDGRNVYPGVNLIAWKTGFHERHVRRLMAALRSRGLLVPVAYEAGGHGKATRYRIVLSAGERKGAYRSENPDTGSRVDSRKDATQSRVTSANPDVGSRVDSQEAKNPAIQSRLEKDTLLSETLTLTPVSTYPAPQSTPTIINHHESIREEEPSVQGFAALIERVDLPEKYKKVFLEAAKLLSFEDGVLVIGVRSTVAADWLEQRAAHLLVQASREMGRDVKRVQFVAGVDRHKATQKEHTNARSPPP